MEHGDKPHRPANVPARVLAKTLDLGAQGEGQFVPGRVELGVQQPEQLEADALASLHQLVAADIVDLRHDELVHGVGLVVEIKAELFRCSPAPLLDLMDYLSQRFHDKLVLDAPTRGIRPLTPAQEGPMVSIHFSRSWRHFLIFATVG